MTADNDSQPTAPAATPSTSQQDSAGHRSPRVPKYGELAPEGWQHEQASLEGSDHNSFGERSLDAFTDNSNTRPAATEQKTPKRLHGVPHNLGTDPAAGLRYSRKNAGATGSAPATKQHSAKPAPKMSPAAPTASKTSAKDAVHGKKNLKTDRIFTILLLLVGLFGTLTLAANMLQLHSNSLAIVGSLPDRNLTAPKYITELGYAAAAAIFLCWGFSLVGSVKRMQNNKIAFWVPLIWGLIALIVSVAATCYMIYYTIPIEILSDQKQLQTVLDSLISNSR